MNHETDTTCRTRLVTRAASREISVGEGRQRVAGMAATGRQAKLGLAEARGSGQNVLPDTTEASIQSDKGAVQQSVRRRVYRHGLAAREVLAMSCRVANSSMGIMRWL